MTQKQIYAIANSEEAMYILCQIKYIQSNMCYKTEFEQKTAKAEMKQLAKELMEAIGE